MSTLKALPHETVSTIKGIPHDAHEVLSRLKTVPHDAMETLKAVPHEAHEALSNLKTVPHEAMTTIKAMPHEVMDNIKEMPVPLKHSEVRREIPNGGYGWVCVFSQLLINAFTWGTVAVGDGAQQ